MISNVATWLRPGGVFVASFGSGAAGEWTGEWLGTTMFFGHTDKVETLRFLVDAKFHVQNSAIEKQDNEDAAFLWIEAIKEN